MKKGRAWKPEMKSQWYWSLTRYSQLAHNGAQRCYKNHPSVCTSIAFDTLKWRVEEYFSTFQGAMQRTCSRDRTECTRSNDTSVSYTAQCYNRGSGKPTAPSTSILVLFISPKTPGNWVSVIIATLCPGLDKESYMYPRLERNREMVPRGELNTKVSLTQDRDTDNFPWRKCNFYVK